MTETDKIYLGIMETLKKYGIEQVVAALEQYITTGDNRYFTSTNGARAAISELSPDEVMCNALKSTLKYDMIQRGHAQVLPNYNKVNQAINEYFSGNKISVDLFSADLDGLMIKMINTDIGVTMDLLENNNDVFRSFLEGYVIKLGNCRTAFNKIPDTEFQMINDYFIQPENENDRQR